MRVVVLAALAVFGLSTKAFAWGDVGHKIICEIAFKSVTANTRTRIASLIQADGQFDTFSDACTWADHPRKRAEEHFVNLARDALGLADTCGGASKCVVSAIGMDFGVLASKSSSQVAKSESLKFLSHWVGDVHQPLHVSFQDDRGGNEIPVSGECDKGLHATWDTCLVIAVLGRDTKAAAAELLASISPAQIEAWLQSTPRDWANESFKITESETTRYCVRLDGRCEKPTGSVNVDATYIRENAPIVREQLQKAGIRLAHLLDLALDQ